MKKPHWHAQTAARLHHLALSVVRTTASSMFINNHLTVPLSSRSGWRSSSRKHTLCIPSVTVLRYSVPVQWKVSVPSFFSSFTQRPPLTSLIPTDFLDPLVSSVGSQKLITNIPKAMNQLMCRPETLFPCNPWCACTLRHWISPHSLKRVLQKVAPIDSWW